MAGAPGRVQTGPIATLIDPHTKAGARALARLENDVVAWLTTVRGDGLPQASVVWFLWQEGRILVFSRPETPKVRNIARSPGVSFVLNSDPRGNDMLTVSGWARIDSTILPADRIDAYVRKYREGIRGLGMTPERFAAAYSVPIVISPVRARYW